MPEWSKARERYSVTSAVRVFDQVHVKNMSCSKPADKGFTMFRSPQGTHYFLVMDAGSANKSASFDSVAHNGCVPILPSRRLLRRLAGQPPSWDAFHFSAKQSHKTASPKSTSMQANLLSKDGGADVRG